VIAAILTIAVSACGQGFLETFEAGVPPADWAVIDNAGSGCVWATNLDFDLRFDNFTGGDGLCAMCDSDACGSGVYLDTELVTHSFVVPAGSTLEYDANYNDLSSTAGDLADSDINVGAGWVNLLSWNEDHGANYALPGEHVSIDLSAYAGELVQLRFHYWDNSGTGWDWYWQVDNVEVTGTTAVETTTWGSIKSLYR